MKKNKSTQTTPLLIGDKLIIISVLAFAILSFVLTFNFYSNEANYIEINLAGETIYTIPLDIDRVISIDDVYHNTIVIENSQVKVINSTCPDGVCENFGTISRSGLSIICMPNKLVIEIKGNSNIENDLPDVIT